MDSTSIYCKRGHCCRQLSLFTRVGPEPDTSDQTRPTLTPKPSLETKTRAVAKTKHLLRGSWNLFLAMRLSGRPQCIGRVDMHPAKSPSSAPSSAANLCFRRVCSCIPHRCFFPTFLNVSDCPSIYKYSRLACDSPPETPNAIF
jgi:hypothetical protein